jgi:hypothetical protein
MPILETINENLLNTNEIYIMQQCNCTAKTSRGLSNSIKNKYKWADIYKQRDKNVSIPGTIQIDSNDHQTKKVIHMFAQYGPGKPNKTTDSLEKRIEWFCLCINEIETLGIRVVAAPYGIGCGLAGGDWEIYKKILDDSNIRIILYKI